MRGAFGKILLAVLTGLGMLFLQAQDPCREFSGVPLVSVPVMSRSAAADPAARMKWSAGMYGFNIYMPGQRRIMPLLPLEARFRIGTDGENLYLDARCETGRDGLLARARKYSGMVCLDDSFEFVIVPRPEDKVPDIYHVVVGSRGGYYTRAMKNNAQVVWKPAIRSESSVKDGVWTCTTVLPLKLFGIERISDGQKIGLRFCRNWRRMAQAFGGQNGTQSSWNQNAAPFFTGSAIPSVVFRKDSPVVQVTRLRDKKKMSPMITVFNPSDKTVTVNVSCLIRPALSQPFPKKFTAALKGGETKSFVIPTLPVSDEEDLLTKLEVTDRQGTLLYRRCFSWQGRVPAERFASVSADRDQLALKYAYYPKTDRMFMQLNSGALGSKEAQITGFSAEVLTDAGRKIAERKFPKKEKGATDYLWQLPVSLKTCTRKDNPSGRYLLKVTAEGVPDISVVKKFERKVFDWEGNRIGTAHTVLVPFTPIRFSGNGRVSVILRDYDLNAAGLFRQVTADGHKLLREGGMRLEAIVNGKPEKVSGRLKLIRKDACGILLQSGLSAGSLKARADILIEYDGMMKYVLTLQKGCKVDSLRLVIPLADKECPLMHTCSDGLRINYGGAVPAGEGCVWDGSKAAKIDLVTTFVPYIWLGSEGPGFSVFGDNDKGWWADRDMPVQKLIRSGESLKLELDLIAKPLALEQDRRITLGFMATPVKPMPEDWRISVVWNQPPPFIRPYLARCERTLANSAPIGGVSPSDDLFPRDFDLTLWHTFAEIRRTGVIPDGFLEKWVAGYRNKDRHDYYYRAIRHSLEVMKVTGTRNPITFYTNARGMRTDIAEALTFQDEWFKEEFQGTRERPAEYGESKAYSVDPVASFRDFAAGWYRTMITTGAADNIYFDDTFLSSNFDHSGDQDAYRLPDGQLQPSVGLFNMRALIRRAATVQAELNRPSWNIVHMTNTHIAPVHSFARINLDWEDHSGLQPYQLRYTREYLRAVSIGRQTGNIPAALTMIDFKGDPGAVESCIRSGIGVALTHEICFGLYYSQSKAYWDIRKEMYELGYGTKKAVTRNYWEKDYPVRFTGDVSSLVIFNRKGEAIVIVCNYGRIGKVSMTAGLEKIGIGKEFQAVNLENGRPIKVRGNTVEFPLKQYDFIAIRLKNGSLQ